MEILQITDGTTTIDFIDPAVSGIKHLDWQPQIAQWKNGGVFQDSPISDGRRLRFRKYQTVQENIPIVVVGDSQDDCITNLHSLTDMLEKAIEYWEEKHNNTPVYLVAKSDNETNTRYALIHSYSIDELPYLFDGPFEMGANDVSGGIKYDAALRDITVGIERGHWQSTIPGTGECVLSGNQQQWKSLIPEESLHITTAGDGGYILYSAFEDSNNNIYFAGEDNIFRSTDQGATWGSVWSATGPSNNNYVYKIIEMSNGYLAAVVNQSVVGATVSFLLSTDNGATWTESDIDSGKSFKSIAETNDGTLLIIGRTSGESHIYRSTNNGTSWTKVFSAYYNSGFSGGLSGITKATNGDMVAIGAQDSDSNHSSGIILVSQDDGLTWTRQDDIYLEDMSTTSGTVNTSDVFTASDGNLYGSVSGQSSYSSLLFKSEDYGVSWQKIAYLYPVYPPTTNSTGPAVISESNSTGGKFLCEVRQNSINYIAISNDYGLSWEYKKISQIVSGFPVIETANDDIFYSTIVGGSDGYIYKLDSNPIPLGQANTCEEVYVTNKINTTNLTHIKISDGGSFTDIFPIASYPQDLLPAVPVVDDAIYFGISTSVLVKGQFDNLVFDIGTPLTSTAAFQLAWEYYNGGWVALSVIDRTNSFLSVGVNSVHWNRLSDWASVAIDGVTAYWVRVRISSSSGTLATPTQQNRNIYSTVNSYIAADNLVVSGDIPALSQIKVVNKSDLDGPAGSAPNLYANRVLVGLRSYDKGPTFQSYLNISDEQNSAGISVSVGTNTTIGNDIVTPTGRSATYNPAGVEAMATRASVTLATTIARDFYGIFRAFLRVRRTAGNATDFDIRLQVSSGSGGVSYTTASKQVQTTTAFELLDFGQVTIPATGSLTLDELGDQTVINIQASAASGTPDLVLYDLILIPVDEWVIDAVDGANESDSDVGRSGNISKYLDIDSITNPKEKIRSLVKQVGSNLITSVYTPNSNGQAILQNKKDQRLWFLAARTSATGTSYSWIARPEVCHSIQLYKAERYLTLRGGS